VTTRFVSFDGTERASGEFAQPDRYRALVASLEAGAPRAIQGAGLSYCLASAGEGMTTISTRYFDRVVGFEPDQNLLTVEPGFTVGRLVEFAARNECYFPVLPGHPAITVGGCTAFNVHGKTQHNVGNFSDHVDALVLFHPDRGELRCSKNEHRDLFELTIGGMGLTGYIASVTLRLRRLRGKAVRRTVHPVANVWETVDLMKELAGDADALYSWNDFNFSGPAFGRGIVYEERFEHEELSSRARYRSITAGLRRIPVNVYGRATTAMINRAFLGLETARATRVTSARDAAFPINGREMYYRLFGARGFREYQLLIPSSAWAEAAQQLRALLARARVPITLGSLKIFSGTGHLLWFRGEGICLTLDVPAAASARLFREMDRFAIDHGAIANLSKDSRIDATTVRQMFSGYDEFGTAVNTFDPQRRFDSALRRRLRI
jgi:decaprenylphospho-beta-D-ribofuranose 2-oxidase